MNSASPNTTARQHSALRCHPYPLKILWLDNESSSTLLDSQEKVSHVLDKARDAGFNVVVPDVVNYMGFAFYRSSILPTAESIGGVLYPRHFDFLDVIVQEAHARGMQVHAGLNLFSRGGKGALLSQRVGPVYEHPEWQTVLYDRLARISFANGFTTLTLSVNSRAERGISVYVPRAGGWLTTAAIAQRPCATAYVVDEGHVRDIVALDQLTTSGIPVPRQGFVAIVEDPASRTALSAVTRASTATLTSEKVRMPASDYPGGILVYVNPARRDVQSHNLAVLAEILQRYPVDGVVLDRCRYDNFRADFSDESLAQFAKWLGRSSCNPEDIYEPPDPVCGTPRREGPLFASWVLWRAMVIRDFIERARNIVRQRPGCCFSVYVGGWYDTYWEVGANWASPAYDPTRNFPFLPQRYSRAAFAHLLDYLSPGVYFREVHAGVAKEPSVESGIELARRVTRGHVQLAPAIYPPLYRTDADVEEAVRLSIQRAGGVMVFSHSHLEKKQLWDAVRRGLDAAPQFLE